MTRRPASLVLAALLALVMAGCSTIPESGPVQTVAPQQQDDDEDRAAFLPNGPTDNMTPAEVVSGFVVAQAAGGDYDVAKEFLTADAAAAWQPNRSVLVHSTQWTVDASDDDDGRVRLRVPAVAEVDPTRRYTPTDRVESKEFELERVRGQWRIGSGGDLDGVVLSVRTFQTVFTPVQLQFFAPGYRRLIPDLRWFPRGDNPNDVGDLAPGVVTAMLGGASPVLQGVTEPAFPAGTELAAPVRTAGGVTTVSVRISGPTPSAETTDHVQQALAQSLGVAPSLIRLVVGGVMSPVAPSPELDQLSIGGPVVVSGDRFGTVTAQGAVQEDRDLGPDIVRLRPAAITVSARQRFAALLTRGGQVDVVTRQQPRMVDERPGLIAPTIDQAGWTYSIPRDDPTGLRATNVDGGGPIAVEGDLGTEIVSIEASADGTRLLVLDRTATGSEAYVAAILRDADGRPIGLSTDRYVIPLGSADAIDATWADSVNVAVLTTASSVQSVTLQQLGGIASNLGNLANARSIVTGASRLEPRALLGTKQILVSTANGWALEFPSTLDVDVLAVQR